MRQLRPNGRYGSCPDRELVPSERERGRPDRGHPVEKGQADHPETVPARTVRLGRERHPLVLPSIRDPRLHLAAVITQSTSSAGGLGIGAVVQILVAILTCAVIEVT